MVYMVWEPYFNFSYLGKDLYSLSIGMFFHSWEFEHKKVLDNVLLSIFKDIFGYYKSRIQINTFCFLYYRTSKDVYQ